MIVRSVVGAPRWVQAVLGSLLAIVVTVPLIAWWAVRYREAMACEHPSSGKNDHETVVGQCRALYERTGDDRYKVAMANALVQLGGDAAYDEAGKLYGELTSGAYYGVAHGGLGYLALGNKDFVAARVHTAIAWMDGRLALDGLREINALVQTAQILDGEGRTGEALSMFDLVGVILIERHVQPDPHLVSRLAHSRAEVLDEIGAYDEARQVLNDALRDLHNPCERVGVAKVLVSTSNNQDDQFGVMRALAVADSASAACKSTASTDLTVTGASAVWRSDAGLALDRLRAVDRQDDSKYETCAKIAASIGDLNIAIDYLRIAARNALRDDSDLDWLRIFALDRGEISELRGQGRMDGRVGSSEFQNFYIRSVCGDEQALSKLIDPAPSSDSNRASHLQCDGPADAMIGTVLPGDDEAERHYIEAIHRTRERLPRAGTDAAYVLSASRVAFERLIGLRMRQRRWNDALCAVELQVDSAVDVPTVAQVVSAWRGRDLVISIVPEMRDFGPERGESYRLRIHDGQLTGQILNSGLREDPAPHLRSVARSAAVSLISASGNKEAGKQLGALLVPQDGLRGQLDMLALGRLSAVPLAALRDQDGTLVSNRRPLARVMSLYARRPETVGDGRSIVLANSDGTLRMASVEGIWLRKRFGSGVSLSTAAAVTRRVLDGAANADFMHIAGHAKLIGLNATLPLADQDVTADELFEEQSAPRMVTIAACESGAVRDEGGWRSLAQAFLKAGSRYVVATDRDVRDGAAFEVMKAFYEQNDVFTDPVAAMARVQVAFDTHASGTVPVDPQQWAAFSVLARPPVISEARAQK